MFMRPKFGGRISLCTHREDARCNPQLHGRFFMKSGSSHKIGDNFFGFVEEKQYII